MRNPWTANNPLMSAWLSAANRTAATVKGHATAAAHREVAAMQAEATRQIVDFWTGAAAGAAPRSGAAPARRKRKR
ncbi:MAG: hypothetical protein ABIX46_12050 [Burkholderiaceae bacterium]